MGRFESIEPAEFGLVADTKMGTVPSGQSPKRSQCCLGLPALMPSVPRGNTSCIGVPSRSMLTITDSPGVPALDASLNSNTLKTRAPS